MFRFQDFRAAGQAGHLWLHFSSEGPHTSSTSTPTGSRASLSVTWSCKAMCGSASGEEGQGLDGPQPVALAHVGTQVMSCRSLGLAPAGQAQGFYDPDVSDLQSVGIPGSLTLSDLVSWTGQSQGLANLGEVARLLSFGVKEEADGTTLQNGCRLGRENSGRPSTARGGNHIARASQCKGQVGRLGGFERIPSRFVSAGDATEPRRTTRCNPKPRSVVKGRSPCDTVSTVLCQIRIWVRVPKGRLAFFVRTCRCIWEPL